MGNSCSSLGCSENTQFETKQKEDKDLENKNHPLFYGKGFKPQINFLNSDNINSNNENPNKRININGNRVLMFVKELPTKVVQEKIRHQLTENSRLVTTSRQNNIYFKDDFKCNTFVKSKSDFDKNIESDRKLFSRSLVGKTITNNRYNLVDPFDNKKNAKKSNQLKYEKTNNNKNNNNDVLFIYASEKAYLNKRLKEDPELVNQKRVNQNNIDLILAIKEASESITDCNPQKKNAEKDISLKDNEEHNKFNESNNNMENKSNNVIVKSKDRLYQKKNASKNKDNNHRVVFKDQSIIDKNNIDGKENYIYFNKISDMNLEVLKYERRKRSDASRSIEMVNGSMMDNPNIESFYIKNKNFDKPEDIMVIKNSLLYIFF